MNAVIQEDLVMLASPRKNIGVSLFMPFNDGTQGDIKNPTKLREILDGAEKDLVTAGIKADVAAKMLKPGYDLAEEETFWRDKFETLALYIFENEFHAYKLPFSYKQDLHVSRFPYLKPLLHDYLTNEKLYVLVLAAGGSRLFKFDKYNSLEITPDSLKKSSKEYADYFQIERETNYHIGREGSGRSREGIISHGSDNTNQLNELRATEYAHIIAKEVKEIISLEKLPLILAGNKSGLLAPTFRTVYDGAGLLPDYVQLETAPLNMEKLRLEVIRVIEDREKTVEKVKFEKVANLLGTGLEESSPEEIVKMAFDGRIDTLFMTDDKDVFGVVNLFNDTCETTITGDPADEDLTNVALIATWTKGGGVYFVSADMTSGKPMMAALRY